MLMTTTKLHLIALGGYESPTVVPKQLLDTFSIGFTDIYGLNLGD